MPSYCKVLQLFLVLFIIGTCAGTSTESCSHGKNKVPMNERIVADYGSWNSPITGSQLVGGNCKTITELRMSREGSPLWLEQTFPEGEEVLFGFSSDGHIVQRSPPHFAITNSVHEYGGGSVCSNAETGDVFVCHRGGLWALSKADMPKLISKPTNEDVRYADIVAHGQFVYAVQEIHKPGADSLNRLVRLNVHSGNVEVLGEGADFYAGPRISPEGRWLAWIQWNNPNMSWEKTEVRILEMRKDGELMGKARTILNNGRSNYGLAWTQESTLWTLSDVEGRWNLYQLDHSNAAMGLLGKALVPDQLGEIGEPLWTFDMDRPFVMMNSVGNNSRIRAIVAVKDSLYELYKNGGFSNRRFGTVQWLGFTVFRQLNLSTDGRKLYCLASGPQRAVSLIQVDLQHDDDDDDDYSVKILRESREYSELSQLPISTAKSLTFTSDGVTVQGYFYAPCSHSSRAPPGQLPPALFTVHGGPTDRTTNALEMNIQYFTSRGFAVFDINYRGSSGMGREFRDYLHGQWGVVDRDDMINGAKFLISTGRVDPNRLGIMGCSSGGLTTFRVLMHPDTVFAAGVSIYGMSDLEKLYKWRSKKGSPKFERENTAWRIAPYPEGIQVYRERSPLHNLDQLNKPIAFLHGTDDTVVPASQSIECHAQVKAKGVPTLLKLFPGEGHGFKKATNIAQAADIAYNFLCRAMGIQPSGNIELLVDNM